MWVSAFVDSVRAIALSPERVLWCRLHRRRFEDLPQEISENVSEGCSATRVSAFDRRLPMWVEYREQEQAAEVLEEHRVQFGDNDLEFECAGQWPTLREQGCPILDTSNKRKAHQSSSQATNATDLISNG